MFHTLIALLVAAVVSPFTAHAVVTVDDATWIADAETSLPGPVVSCGGDLDLDPSDDPFFCEDAAGDAAQDALAEARQTVSVTDANATQGFQVQSDGTAFAASRLPSASAESGFSVEFTATHDADLTLVYSAIADRVAVDGATPGVGAVTADVWINGILEFNAFTTDDPLDALSTSALEIFETKLDAGDVVEVDLFAEAIEDAANVSTSQSTVAYSAVISVPEAAPTSTAAGALLALFALARRRERITNLARTLQRSATTRRF